MDHFEDILNECIKEAIDASNISPSQKYIELNELSTGKRIAAKVKRAIKPNFMTQAEKASKKAGQAASKVGSAASRVKGLATVAFVLVLLKKARDVYRNMVHKRCAKFQGNELIICKIKTIEFTLSQLSSYKNECSKTKDPQDCTKRINEAMSKLIKQRDKLKSKLIKR